MRFIVPFGLMAAFFCNGKSVNVFDSKICKSLKTGRLSACKKLLGKKEKEIPDLRLTQASLCNRIYIRLANQRTGRTLISRLFEAMELTKKS